MADEVRFPPNMLHAPHFSCPQPSSPEMETTADVDMFDTQVLQPELQMDVTLAADESGSAPEKEAPQAPEVRKSSADRHFPEDATQVKPEAEAEAEAEAETGAETETEAAPAPEVQAEEAPVEAVAPPPTQEELEKARVEEEARAKEEEERKRQEEHKQMHNQALLEIEMAVR